MASRPRSEPFRPVATLGLIYFALIFLALTLLLISPTLWDVAQGGAPVEQKQALVEAAARKAARPMLPFAFFGALVLTGLLIRARILPGFRTPRA